MRNRQIPRDDLRIELSSRRSRKSCTVEKPLSAYLEMQAIIDLLTPRWTAKCTGQRRN
jgi:hypothetical protein